MGKNKANVGKKGKSRSAFSIKKNAGKVFNLKHIELKIKRQLVKDITVSPKSHKSNDILDEDWIGSKAENVDDVVEISHNNEDCYRCMDLSDDGSKCLLFMKDNVCFWGIISLSVIKGMIRIHGYKMDTAHSTATFTSTCLTALSTIECCKQSSMNRDISRLKEYLLHKKASFVKKCHSLEKDYPVICLVNYDEIIDPGIKIVISQPKFSKILPSKPQFFNNISCPYPCISSKFWDNTPQEISELVTESSFSICVAGGKDVGKSTFCRLLSNCLLERYPTIFYLECDVGQTEFTAPGIISLCEIKTPLTGIAPFLHQQRPLEASYFGDITPRDQPQKYLSMIQNIFKIYNSKYIDDGPLIINTQGWIKGLGSLMLTDLLKIIEPTIVIQIHPPNPYSSKSAIKLNEDIISRSPRHFWGTDQTTPDETDEGDLECSNSQLVHITMKDKRTTSQSDDRSLIQQFHSPDYRLTTLLSYIGQLNISSSTDESSTSSNIQKPLMSIIPYEIKLDSIFIHLSDSKVELKYCLAAINACLVSLSYSEKCKIEITESVANRKPRLLNSCPVDAKHLGFGLVRNIDPHRGLLYILSPEPLSVMERINLFVKGNIDFPPVLLKEAAAASSTGAPYCSLSTSYPKAKGSGARKPRFNLLRKGLDSSSRKSDSK